MWTWFPLMELQQQTPQEEHACPPAYSTSASVSLATTMSGKRLPPAPPSSASNSPANGSAAPRAVPLLSGARGRRCRSFRALPIGKQPTVLELKVPRVYCCDCGATRQVNKINCAAPRSTHPFVRTLCPGTVATHDHPGCRRPSAGQLGHQGNCIKPPLDYSGERLTSSRVLRTILRIWNIDPRR